MSELSHFLPGLMNSVTETRTRAAEYQRRLARMQAGAASQVTMKQLAASNRKKVLAALVADGEAERQSGGKGLFMAINAKVSRGAEVAEESAAGETSARPLG